MRSRLQLSLPFGSPSAPSAPSASVSSNLWGAKTDSVVLGAQGAATVSKTRLLVDAIQRSMPKTRVIIVDTRSVLLSQSQRDGMRVIRVHQMFLDADDATRAAVALYLASGNKHAGAVVDEFVRHGSHLLSFAARPLKADAPKGQFHDLGPVFRAINSRYFENAVAAEIGWGQAGVPMRRSRRSIIFGSYDHRARRITIHPVLDALHVPEMVVGRIVHHEMLHEKIGEGRSVTGRRIVHSPQFRMEEATYEAAAAADAWLESHLDHLLRWRR